MEESKRLRVSILSVATLVKRASPTKLIPVFESGLVRDAQRWEPSS
jgi:hypothetical protein